MLVISITIGIVIVHWVCICCWFGLLVRLHSLIGETSEQAAKGVASAMNIDLECCEVHRSTTIITMTLVIIVQWHCNHCYWHWLHGNILWRGLCNVGDQ